jgi:septal ring factor EnvC (AmiA/AmiB activator)
LDLISNFSSIWRAASSARRLSSSNLLDMTVYSRLNLTLNATLRATIDGYAKAWGAVPFDRVSCAKVLAGEQAGICTQGSDRKFSDLRSQISDLKSQISNLRSQISNLKSQISDLKSQISNLKSQISSQASVLKITNLRFEV